MHFYLPRHEFITLLNKIHSIVPLKPALPILSNVKISAKQGRVTLSATDFTMSIETSMEAEISQEGSTTVPARKFVQLIKELTASTLEIHAGEDHNLSIRCGTSQFTLLGLSPSSYPELPQVKQGHVLHIPQQELREAMRSCLFAVSKEESAFSTMGLLMQVEENLITFVGTDAKRLSKVSIQVPNTSMQKKYILPSKACDEFLRSLDPEDSLQIHLFEDQVGFEDGSTILVTKLLTGQYPDYARVIPKQIDSIIPLHKDELVTLLKQMSLFVAQTHQSVKFSFGNRELRINANTADLGKADVRMPVHYQSDPMEIAFNPVFFLDILRHCEQETIHLGLTDSFNPGVIFRQEYDGNGYNPDTDLFILMPMRLESA